MGVEGYCTCSKDVGEKVLTFQSTNDNKEIQNSPAKNTRINLYDNFYNNNINLKNSNVFSVNSNINNNETSRKWQNCVPQKNSTEIFIGRASDVSYNINNENNNSLNSNTEKNNNLLNLPLGDKYDGEIKDNKPNGKGIYYSISGEIKEGIFKDGLLNGKGKMTLNNGFFIEGDFINDELNGYGKTVNINGEIYEGEFKNGIREGKGKLILSNEDRFEGNFIKGKFEGFGKFIKKDGEIYEGEFVEGIPNGKGHKKYKNGNEYNGNFKNGKENGYGTKKFGDGEIYEGEFLDGVKSGKGKHIFKDGQKYEGDFYEDHYNGNGTYLWPDGLKYVGEFKDDKVEGKGILTWPNGDKYEGYFIDGKYNGFGVETKIDGTKYEGEFKNDDYEGHGIKIFSNGEKYDGEFHKISVEYKNNIEIKDDKDDEKIKNNKYEKNYNGIIEIEINEDENNNGGKISSNNINSLKSSNDRKDNILVNEEENNNEENGLINNNLILFNEDTFNEFTFILLTNFEAKNLNIELAKENIILNLNENDKLTEKEFINKIKNNIALFLNCKNEESLNDIYKWLFYLLNVNDNDQNIMQNEFLTILSNIKEYPKDQELFLTKKVKKYLLPKKDIIFEKLKSYNNKYISFILLKKIIEDEKIELKEQYFVYLFYALKKFDDPMASLNDLKIELLFDIINDTDNDSKMDEESDLEISDDEYNQIITNFQIKLLHYINSNHTNLRFILNGLIQVTTLGDENNIIEVVLIKPFFERMKEIGIWLNNDLEIYCIFNRYKLSEKYEGINIYLLEEELKNLKVNYNKFNGNNNSNNSNEQVFMENIKEESEENSMDS